MLGDAPIFDLLPDGDPTNVDLNVLTSYVGSSMMSNMASRLIQQLAVRQGRNEPQFDPFATAFDSALHGKFVLNMGHISKLIRKVISRL